MMRTSNTSKTAEILARYRPIAPKPGTAVVDDQLSSEPNNNVVTNSSNSSTSAAMPQNIRDSPYLRSVWPHLQARPTRTRKRGRTSLGPTPSNVIKRSRLRLPNYQFLQSLPCNYQLLVSNPVPSNHINPPPPNLAGDVQLNQSIPVQNFINLDPTSEKNPVQNTNLDLNHVPEEKDLPLQLQSPVGGGGATTNVIAPKPVRLVSSSISIKSISKEVAKPAARVPTKAAEIEEEVESEAFPVVLSDSKNRVRLANSAYKKLVGQPECCWLGSMTSSKGICGEVILQFPDPGHVPFSSDGFYCLVVIEWGNSTEKKRSIKASCDVVKLFCERKDYLFAWRFHTQEADEAAAAAHSASNF